jgi:mono/diheme cytochrome c family protein
MRIAIAALACGLAGCGPSDSANGPEVFATICANCHGPTGRPPAEMVARLNVHDLTAPEFRKRVTIELVEAQVHWGSKNKLMPAFDGALRDDQISAVAAYVAGPSFVK